MFPAQSLDLRRSPLVVGVRGRVPASPGLRRLVSIAPLGVSGGSAACSSTRGFALPASFSASLLAGPGGPGFFALRVACGVATTCFPRDFHPFITSMLDTHTLRAKARSLLALRYAFRFLRLEPTRPAKSSAWADPSSLRSSWVSMYRRTVSAVTPSPMVRTK